MVVACSIFLLSPPFVELTRPTVAAGLCVAAIGSDTAGSIRCPAALCGIVGHRPSAGLLSAEGMVPLAPSFDTAACICFHPRDASGKQVGQRSEVGHRRRLAAVERVLDGAAPSTGFEVDEVGHVARGNAQTKGVTLDRRAVDELCMRPD